MLDILLTVFSILRDVFEDDAKTIDQEVVVMVKFEGGMEIAYQFCIATNVVVVSNYQSVFPEVWR